MGTAVLRSHPDPFLHIDSFGSRTPPPPMKPHHRKALRPAPFSAIQSRLRRSPASLPARAAGSAGAARSAGRRVTFSAEKENAAAAAAAMVERFPSHNIVMEKVKILKRGEDPAPPPPAADFRSGEAASPPPPSDRRSNGGDVSILPVDRRSNGGAVSPLDRRSNGGDVSILPVDRRSNGGAVSTCPRPGPASTLFSTTPLGPEPEILPKQIGFSAGVPAESAPSPILSKLMLMQNELSTPPQASKSIMFSTPVAYAGPGYINSPSPSSVPFPALFMSKSEAEQAAKFDSVLATRNLRGLLRLGDSP